MKFPDNVKYTKDHEWISVQDNIGTIGITDYAQSELGDVVFIDINSDSGEFKQGDTFGSIEAVKTVSDLFAPVSGKIIEVNKKLGDFPEVANSDPYGLGWIVKIELSNPDEVNELLDAQAYRELVGQ